MRAATSSIDESAPDKMMTVGRHGRYQPGDGHRATSGTTRPSRRRQAVSSPGLGTEGAYFAQFAVARMSPGFTARGLATRRHQGASSGRREPSGRPPADWRRRVISCPGLGLGLVFAHALSGRFSPVSIIDDYRRRLGRFRATRFERPRLTRPRPPRRRRSRRTFSASRPARRRISAHRRPLRSICRIELPGHACSPHERKAMAPIAVVMLRWHVDTRPLLARRFPRRRGPMMASIDADAGFPSAELSASVGRRRTGSASLATTSSPGPAEGILVESSIETSRRR